MIKHLKKLWYDLSDVGIDASNGQQLNACLHVSNRIAAYYFVLLGAFFGIVTFNWPIFFLLGSSIFAASFIFILHARKQYFWGRVLVTGIPLVNILIATVWIYIPIDKLPIGLYYLLIGSAVIPILVWTSKEKGPIIFFSAINFLSLIFLEDIRHHLYTPILFLTVSLKTAEMLCMLEALFFISIFLLHYKSVNNAYEQALVQASKNIENSQTTALEYQRLADLSFDLISICNFKGFMLELNPSWANVLGYSIEEIKSRSIMEFIHPDDVENTLKVAEEMIQKSSGLTSFKNRYRTINGQYRWLSWNAYSVMESQKIYAVTRDITDAVHAENTLRYSENRYKAVMNQTLIGVYLLDMKEYHFIDANDAYLAMIGYTMDELRNKTITEISTVPLDIFKQRIEELQQSKKLLAFESNQTRKDGKIVSNEAFVNLIDTLDGPLICVFIKDITERKAHEARIKETLHEKEILISEIHHRVKNNLTVVSSLLQLQSHKIEDVKLKGILKDCQTRIDSMALIHEKLYQQETLAHISFDQYLQQLIDQIHFTYQNETLNVTVELEAEHISIDVTKAIPCGLLLNELLVNAFKHAFEGKIEGKILVTLRQSVDQNGDHLKIKVQDNGMGFNYRLAMDRQSLGLTLIEALAKQLRAQYSFQNVGGTIFEIEFSMV